MTAPPLDDVSRLVIVAPHPDDEVLACGLLLAHAADRGLDVRVLAVTDGEAAYREGDPTTLAAVRRREQGDALAALGLSTAALHRIGVPDGAVAEHVGLVSEVIRRHCDNRTLLVAPSVHDWHPDHVACGRAAQGVTAVRPRRIWSSLFWAYHHPTQLIASAPTLLRVDGDARQHAARARAVMCHDSQFRRPGGEPILTRQHIRHLEAPHELYVEEGR